MKQVVKLFKIVVILLGISSLSPLLVPFAIGEDGSLNVLGYISGVMFWAGLILAIIAYILLKKVWEKSQNEKESIVRRISVLRFFSSPHAKVVDGVMIIGMAGVLLSLVNNGLNEWLIVIFLIMMLAGIYGHFLVNGCLYESILNYKNKKPELEKGKE